MHTEQSLRLEQARLDALFHLSQINDASLQEIASSTLEQGIALTNSRIGFVGFLNEDNIIFEISLGINLGKGDQRFLQFRHW